ncbi:MAG: hypothetical protein ACP5XB_02105 [Isosphaeraceae bacterium]
MRLRDILLFIAYLYVLLWLARVDPAASVVFGLGAPSALISYQYVEHLKLRRKRFGFSEKVAAYLLGFLLSLFFLVCILFVLCLLAVGLIWLCTGMY